MSDAALDAYEKMVSDPLVPITLRIGIAGHRALPEDQLERIRPQITECYAALHDAIRSANETDVARHIYASHNGAVFRLISSLAEGADRLCIEANLVPFEYELAAVLPFASEEYETDFLPENSVVCAERGSIAEYRALLEKLGYGSPGAPIIELDGDRRQSTNAYDTCSDLLVEHSDVLLAVYDGNHEEGHGTSYAVDAARRARIPVIHISTVGGAPILYPSKAIDGENRVAFTASTIQNEVHRIVLFQDILRGDAPEADDASAEAEVLNRFTRYAADDNLRLDPETAPDFDRQGPITIKKLYRNSLAKAFDGFKKRIASPAKVNAAKEKIERLRTLPAGANKPKTDHFAAMPNRFYAAFLRADHLATYYSNVHRSTFLLIYCLGSAALISAVLSLALKPYFPPVVTYLVLSELLLLGAIFKLFREDHRRNYHDRWLEYRCLAEFLRPMIYLSLLGKSYHLASAHGNNSVIDRELVGHHSAARSWIYIYSETLIRWSGFDGGRLTKDRRDRVTDFVSEKWIDGQIAYHTNNASIMQVLGERLGNWSMALFFITVAAVILKLMDIGFELFLGEHSSVAALLLGLTAAICPILATAAFAIRNHAEFDISAQRSLTMRALLIGKQRELIKGGPNATAAALVAKLEAVAEITTTEAAEWLEIYEVKESEPA